MGPGRTTAVGANCRSRVTVRYTVVRCAGVSAYGRVVSLVTVVVVVVVCASAIGESAVSAATKADVRTSEVMMFPRVKTGLPLNAREEDWFPSAASGPRL